MITYIIRRVLWAVVLLLIITFLTFIIFYVLPVADPAELRAGKQATPELIEAIRKTLHLDQPFYVQYLHYLERLVFHADFGHSYTNNTDVKEQIFSAIPATFSLAIGAAILWLIMGIGVGILSAVRRGTATDRLSMGAALIGISAPVYWLGLVGIYLFSRDLGAIPIFAGSGTYVPFSEDPVKWADSLILPWIVLSITFTAVYARFLRSSLLDVMGEDYIRTARAKGLTERKVVFKHAVRSGITPIVTIFGLDLGILLGGAILTETVFNIPGIGRLSYQAIQVNDLPMIQGTVLVAASAIIILNLLVDIAYAFLDPRVRYS